MKEPRRTRAFAKKHRIPQVFSDMGAAITVSGCDVVDVCLSSFYGGMDDRVEVLGTGGVVYADLFMGNAALAYSQAGTTKGWSFAVFEEAFNQGYPYRLHLKVPPTAVDRNRHVNNVAYERVRQRRPDRPVYRVHGCGVGCPGV